MAAVGLVHGGEVSGSIAKNTTLYQNGKWKHKLGTQII